MRRPLREHVVEHPGDEESDPLVYDETSCLKEGEKSAGVARQYAGTARGTINV